MNGPLNATARFINQARVRHANDHDVDVVWRCALDATHPGRERSIQERRLDPVDTLELLREQHGRARCNRHDLAQRGDEGTVRVGRDQAGPADRTFDDDSGIEETRNLAVRCGISNNTVQLRV